MQKPVLAIYRPQEGKILSAMIRGTYVWYCVPVRVLCRYRYVYSVPLCVLCTGTYVYGQIFFCRVLEIFPEVFFNVDVARKNQHFMFFLYRNRYL